MHRRSMLPAAMALTAVSVVLLVGSVALALVEGPAGSVFRGEAELPSSLFAAEEEDEFAPVADVITTEIVPVHSPSPSPSPIQRAPAAVREPAKAPTAPAPPKVSFELTFSSEPKGQKVRYTAAIINRSEHGLGSVVFRSHVPQGAQWLSNGCEPGLKKMTYRIDEADPHDVCVKAEPDETGHDVRLDVPTTIPSGGKVTVTFEVAVLESSQDVIVTHAHASAGGVTADSSDVTTGVR